MGIADRCRELSLCRICWLTLEEGWISSSGPLRDYASAQQKVCFEIATPRLEPRVRSDPSMQLPHSIPNKFTVAESGSGTDLDNPSCLN